MKKLLCTFLAPALLVLPVFTLSAGADVNVDDSVDGQDYMLVKRHVLGTYVIG